MNHVALIGRITRDIDIKFAAGTGLAIAKFTLAVNRRGKDKGADFINCIAFGKTGEIITQHFMKGSAIAIEGHIQTGSYEAKDGTKRYTTDVIIDNFDFIESKKQETEISNGAFSNTPYDKNDDMTQIEDDGDIPF